MMFLDLTLRMVIVYAMPEEAKEQAIADTCELMRAGKLQHRIAHNLPFSEMVQAQELIEQGGFRGCVIVSIDE
jgi:NADPH:quinone reductase-like Zn-dependent oxidoreductase